MNSFPDKIVVRVDASSLKDSGCLRRFFLTVFKGYRPRGKTANDLVYGSAFHKAVETYDLTNGDTVKTLDAAIEYWEANEKEMFVKENSAFLTKDHLLRSVTSYLGAVKTNPIFQDNRVLKIGDEVMVEKKFSILYFENSWIRIYIQGTLDKLAQFNSGPVALCDWKTTKAWDIKGFFEGFKVSPQLRLYLWALKRLAAEGNEEFAKIFKDRKTYAYIYGAFLSKDGTKFERSLLMNYSDRDMELFEKMLSISIAQLITWIEEHKRTGSYPLPYGIINGTCQAPFGGMCKYFNACSSMVGLSDGQDPDRLLEGRLNASFEQKEYRPLLFGGEGKIKNEK